MPQMSVKVYECENDHRNTEGKLQGGFGGDEYYCPDCGQFMDEDNFLKRKIVNMVNRSAEGSLT